MFLIDIGSMEKTSVVLIKIMKELSECGALKWEFCSVPRPGAMRAFEAACQVRLKDALKDVYVIMLVMQVNTIEAGIRHFGMLKWSLGESPDISQMRHFQQLAEEDANDLYHQASASLN
jgi:hypothetical protein